MPGKHKRLTPVSERFERRFTPEPNTGCWLWTGHALWSGYGQFRVSPNSTDTHKLAHRVSWELYRGEIPDRLFVCHTCDVRCCVNPQHLFLGTAKDNTQDAVKEKRMGLRIKRPDMGMKGTAHPKAKLTDEQVRAIRKAQGRLVDLAAQFGVSIAVISKVRLRQLWRHIE